MSGALDSILSVLQKLDVLAHACNPSIQELENGGPASHPTPQQLLEDDPSIQYVLYCTESSVSNAHFSDTPHKKVYSGMVSKNPHKSRYKK